MAIRSKIGVCCDCPEGSKEQPLTAKRCHTHYWQHRSRVNAAKPKNRDKQERQIKLNTYFANQILQMPERCEECSRGLPKQPAWMRRACVAHILPKRHDFGFPSVADHPVNKMFLCIDCHTNFDNMGDVFILKMKLLPVIRERVAILLPFLTVGELNKVPEYLLQNEK